MTARFRLTALLPALLVLFLLVMPDASPARILTFAILGVFALIIPGVIMQKQVRG